MNLSDLVRSEGIVIVPCAQDGCERPVHARGYCRLHYERLLKAGRIQPRSKDPVERFWSHVDKRTASPCWLWTGTTSNGYGYVRIEGRNRPAHRVAYELVIGSIPQGLFIDHVRDRGCRHRSCVNPAHLEPVTNRVNVRRGDGWAGTNARKTHCKHGHEFTPENTWISREGFRSCRACRRVGGRQQ